MRLKIQLLLLFVTITSCAQDYGQLTLIDRLPKKLKEVSGIQKAKSKGLIWMINDSGNKNRIYGVNKRGNIKEEIKVKRSKNVDWEDLTKDDKGNLYIGDFGNNENTREDLTIYKISKPDKIKEGETKASKITFNFPEQTEFPPKNNALFYDVEAFIFLNDYFYLFTRNRSDEFDGTTFLYKIPAKKGKHNAQLITSYKTCDDAVHCVITAADISPDKSKIVLLGHDRIWVLSGFEGDNFYSGNVQTILLGHSSQKESVCFADENTLYIADEEGSISGRNLYSYILN